MPSWTIVPRNVHCDEKSFEKETGKTKRKYKAAGIVITALDFYPFYILTSTSDTYSLSNRIDIRRDEWEEKKKIHLNGDVGYISPDHIEILDETQIDEKVADPENGFKKVAKLPERIFNRLKILVENRGRQSHQAEEQRYLNRLAAGVPVSSNLIANFKETFGLQ